MKFPLLGFVLLGLLCGNAARARGAAIGLDPAGTVTNTFATGTNGFFFTVNTPIEVTDLGVFAFTGFVGGALSESHPVGLWAVNTPANPLAMATVTPTSFEVGNFRFAALAQPLFLTQGQYYVGAFYADTTDAIVAPTTGFFNPQPPQITPNGAGSIGGSSLAFDSSAPDTSNLGSIGGDFRFVPEPSTLTLLGIGSAGLAGYGWRKRRTAASIR